MKITQAVRNLVRIEQTLSPTPGSIGSCSLIIAALCSNAYAIDIAVPSVAVMTVDQPAVFTAANQNVISLSGTLNGGDSVSLTATSGSLSLSGINGLSFSNGDGVADATMTFTGTLADVNNALSGLSYSPATGVAGTSSLSFSVSGTQSANSSLAISVNATMDAEAARDTILSGVTSLADPTQPGYMVVYGDNAHSITNYPGGNIDDPMVAAATWGAGKVLAMPDHQWLDMGVYGTDASTGTFYKNSITWLTGSTDLGNKIVVYNKQATADWLTAEGYTNVVNTTSANLATDLVGADTFIAGWLGTNIDATLTNTIRSYVTDGGSMFITEYGPGYSLWWGKSTEDVPGNILLREAGIGFTQQYPHGGVQNINRASGQVTAGEVLAIIQDPLSYTESEKTLAASIFDKLNSILKNDDPLQKRLDDVFWTKIGSINPTPDTPVSDSLEKALLNREGIILRDLDVAEMTAHRTALAVGATAPRVNKAVSIPATVQGHDYWVIDTGTYAAPGEIVTVTVPAALAGIGAKVQVGHLRTDTGDSNYYTMPYQQLFFDVDTATVQVASPHGGLIMLVAPSGTEWTGSQSVQIDGAVEAPYFEYGVTTNAEWVAGIRDRETPFGVLVSDTSVLVIESEQYLRTLDNPDGVMEIHRNKIWWIDDFYNYHRGRPLRTHHDYQPVGGAASMPLSYGMGSNITDYDSLVVNGEALTMHERGHHADHWNLFFTDFAETTPNMGGKFAQQKYLPFSWKQELAVGRVNNYQRSLTDDLWNHYNHYAVDVKGTFVDSIGEVFGWDNVRTIVHLISADSSVSTNEDKMDAWLIHTSQTVGYDVSPFLEAWQLSFSSVALTTVSSLSKWHMIETIGDDLIVKQDTAVTFPNPSQNDFSYDGTLNFTGITSPSNGNLVDNGNGTYTYTPNNGFTGDDSVEYTVTNATGNAFTKTIKISVNAAANHPVLESGDAHVSTTGWTTVTLDQSFSSMVVVAQPILAEGSAPVVTRIRNASGNSFEVMLQRADGQTGDIENVQVRYLAVEEGVYDVATHGVKMEAVKYSSTVTDISGSFVGETRTMAHNLFDHYYLPAIFGQVMSYNDSDWSSFWFKQAGDKLQLGKHVGEDSNTARVNETVGYIIMESGTMQLGDYKIQAGGLGYDGYDGFSGLGSSTATHNFTRFPNVTSGLVSADISVPWGGSNPGDEGFWTVQRPTNNNGLAAGLIEDQIGDAEQDAGSKGGSYLLVSYTGDKPVTGDDSAVALEGFSTLIKVLDNDASGPNGSLNVTGFTQPSNGSVVDNGDGSFTYTPNASYTGADSFTYTTSNGGGSDTAVVSIDVQASAVSQPGILREKWTGLSGTDVSDLTGSVNYPDSPDFSSILNSFEAPSSDGDSYGQRLTGLLVPPTTGDYTFWIASDDDGDLYLSSDHSAVNKSRIAYVDGWVGEKAWTQKSSQQSVVVTLEAGKAYYIEALYKEGGGGDHLAVAWQGPGITQAVIDGQYLHTLGNNGPSVASAIADVQVNENAAATVIDLSSVFADVDPGDPLSIEVASNSNTSLVSTSLVGTQLTLNYLANQSGTATISVRATDRLNTVAVDTFQLEVISNNVAPSLVGGTFGIAEDAAVSAAVGSVVGTDPDVGDALSYSITTGNTGGAFVIDTSTGSISVASSLNYEAISSYALTVQVQDAAGLTDSAAVTVNVTDVDESSLAGVQAWEEAVNAGTAFAHKRTEVLAGNTIASVDMSVLSGSVSYEFVVDAEELAQTELRLLDGSGWSLRFEQWNNSNKLGVTHAGVADYQLTAEAGESIDSPYGALHHIVYVVDSANTLTSVYVDGTLVGTLAQVPLINSATATLGRTDLRSDSSPGIHAFAAYNEVLTAAEIALHSEAWLGAPVNTAPVADDATFAVAENTNTGTSVGTVVAADAGDTITYAITAGNAGGEFSINTSTGEITTVGAFDYETTSQYVLTVSATDTGALSDTATITINVTNVNEAIVANDDSGTLAENATIGSAVATVTTSDSDAGDSVSFAITGGNTGNAFAIDANGNIASATTLDFETTPSYSLIVTATDGGGLSDTATVTVTVTNVNEAIVANDTSGTLAESAAIGSAVATVTTSDPDAGDSVSYAITGGNTGNAFAIDTNGNITTVTGLNYETTSSYSLTVTATDGGGLSDTATVTVTVTNVNEAIVANDNSGTLAEDATIGSAVATVTTSDQDAGDSVSFAITSGNTGSAFAIDSNGNITTATALDFETTASYSLIVTAIDGGGLSDTATVTVAITNANEAIVANDTSGTLAEDAAIGSAVATVTTSDADAGDFVSFAITGGNTGSAFAIDANGNITTVTALDFETTPSYSLIVTATDGGGLTDTASVTVNVSNVDTEDTDGDGVVDALEIALGTDPNNNTSTPGSSYVDLLAWMKMDEGAGTSSGDSSGYNRSGALSGTPTWMTGYVGSQAVDFDGVDDSITVTPAIGGSSNTATISGWIKRNGSQNDNAGLVFMRGSNVACGVNITGNALRYHWDNGHWSWDSGLTPPDGEWCFFTLVIEPTKATMYMGTQDGTLLSAENIATHTAEQLTEPLVIGQDTNSSTRRFKGGIDDVRFFGRTMSAADVQTLFDEQLVNTAPVASDDTFTLVEDSSIGAIVGSVSATDINASNTLNYAITAGNAGGQFAINAATGELTTAAAFDFETATQHVLTVTVSDDATPALSDTATITVNVTDVNEAIVANDSSGTLAEDATVGSTVATVSTSDPDTGDSVSFAITGGNTGNAFAIDANGNITTAIALDFETTPSYSLTVTATDGGGLSDTATVTVTVTNVNEAIVANDNSGTLAENAAIGSAVATVTTSDPDAGDSVSFAITGGNTGNAFAVDTNGNITTATGLNYEATPSYSLIVTATDGGGLSDSATVTVTVTNVNEAIVANDTSGTLAEDAIVGSAVATVTTSDPDAGDSVSFAITGGNTGNAFAIDTNGNITSATSLDFETTPSYSLTVTATDGSGLSDTATVTVTITDVVETTAPVVATGSASNLGTATADLNYSITDDGGEAPSVTLYYGETDGGTTPAGWTNNVAVGAKATGTYVEGLTGLTEGTSYYFTITATNSVGATWGSTGSFDTTADATPKMVRTTVNAVSSTNWTTVDLGQNYTSAVIVATPIYADSTQVPVVTRIRNVSGSSFDLKLDRADGQTGDVTCNVSVVAVEEGVYTLANDGVQMEAVKFTSTITANRSGWNAEARTYQNSYTTPVVVGQVMSANDANWSTFWSMGSTRLNPADASNLNVGKHVAEDTNTTRANETIGYIVIESGSGTINGVAYTAAVGSDIVRNYENSASGYSYSLTGLTSASAAALSSAGMDGSDGAWPVLNGVDALSSTAVKLIVDEDQFQDSERKHATEQINYIIFE